MKLWHCESKALRAYGNGNVLAVGETYEEAYYKARRAASYTIAQQEACEWDKPFIETLREVKEMLNTDTYLDRTKLLREDLKNLKPVPCGAFAIRGSD